MPHASSTHRNIPQSKQCLEGLYEHRADRCRQVDEHVQSVGLQLSPESFGTTRPLCGACLSPCVSPSHLAHWFANFTGPKSNPRRVPLSKPLQRLVFSRESLTLGLVPILAPSPQPPCHVRFCCHTHPSIPAVTVTPGTMLGMYYV